MASKRRLRRKACGHKVRHPDKAGAHGALRRIKRKKGVVATEGLGVYHCPYCGGWHLGHRIGMGGSELLAAMRKSRGGA